MITIPEQLPSLHRQALLWFVENEGRTVPWPLLLPDRTLLANVPKGIYKPIWSDYALSVKQTLGGPYADREPTYNESGEWSYLYYQEEEKGKDPENLTSSKAMRLCIKDEVPVGVIRQVQAKPTSSYSVLGIARVLGKAAGYYLLQGFSLSGTKRLVDFSYPEPSEEGLGILHMGDHRVKRLRSVVQRQGQPRFREELMQVYERRCAVSNCDVSDVLEAAHIVPYRGAHTNDISNGVILRADFHILFDEGLLTFDAESLKVRLSPQIESNEHYEPYNNVLLHEGARRIDRDLLRAHRHYCGF